MDGDIGANVRAADVKGQQAAQEAGRYEHVLTWLRYTAQSSSAAAGHPAVAQAFESFLDTASRRVDGLRLHGVETGQNLRTSAAIIADTDLANATIFDAAARQLGDAAGPNGGHRP